MTIEIWLLIALIFSLFVNIVLLWFAREQSNRLLVVSENISDLNDIIENYQKHLKLVYSMEMFYGDETLKFLIDHTRDLSQLIESDFGDTMAIMSPYKEDLEETESFEEESKEEAVRQDVFYGGTRTSNS